MVTAIPDIRPFSDMRVRQSELVEKLSDGPIVLAQRGRPAAVLVSLEMWNSLIKRLEDLDDALAVMEARQNPEPAVDFDDYLKERGVSVSTGA